MPQLEVVVSASVDGVPLDGFPVVKRLTTTEKEARDFVKATGAGYVALCDNIASVAALIMQSDQTVSVKLNGSATSFTLNAGGLLLLLDCLLSSGAATNATFENTSGASANVRGRTFGS